MCKPVNSSQPPLISLVTINLNNLSELELTLKSISEQEPLDSFEHIIIYGGSKDNSTKLIKDYANNFKNVKWISEPDAGIYFAMNKGLKFATGSYVCFLNSGDRLYEKDTLKSIFKSIQKNKHKDIFYGDLAMDNNDGEILRYWRSSDAKKWKIYLGWMTPHPMTCVSRRLIERIGLFDTELKIAADYDFLLRCLFETKCDAYYMGENLVKMRAGGVSNSSFKHMLYANLEVLFAWRKIHPFFAPVWIFFTKPLSKLLQKFFNDVDKKRSARVNVQS